jgi:hypothetical protein
LRDTDAGTGRDIRTPLLKREGVLSRPETVSTEKCPGTCPAVPVPDFARGVAVVSQPPSATVTEEERSSRRPTVGNVSPACVTRHIERVSDKATESMYYGNLVIPLAGREPPTLSQS